MEVKQEKAVKTNDTEEASTFDYSLGFQEMIVEYFKYLKEEYEESLYK